MAKFKKAKTLLDGIQQGREEVKNSSFSFSENTMIKVFERREVITPYLSTLDQKDIRRNLMNYQFNPRASENAQEYEKLVPSHLSNDIYSMYVNEQDSVKLAKRTEKNTLKHKIISRINKSNLKILTNGSHLKTMIVTTELCNYIYDILRVLPEDQKKQFMDEMGDSSNEGDQENSGGGQGKGKGSNDPGQGSQPPGSQPQSSGGGAGKYDIDDILDDSQGQLQKALDRAEKTINKIEDSGLNIDEKDQDQVREVIGKIDQLDAIKKELEQISVSKGKLSKAIEKILDNSINFFSKKAHEYQVPLLEADEILDIEGIEFLHPIFRNTGIFDLSVTERRFTGQFDLYVDNSGSMGSACMQDDKGRSISSMTLAKALALNMKRMGLLKDLYEFQNTVTKLNNSELAIFEMGARGGTNIDNVLLNVAKTGRNSIILTDGEDHVNYHHGRVFFLGIAGVRFDAFKTRGYRYNSSNGDPVPEWQQVGGKKGKRILSSADSGKMFIKNKQCCIFDGKTLTYPTLDEK